MWYLRIVKIKLPHVGVKFLTCGRKKDDCEYRNCDCNSPRSYKLHGCVKRNSEPKARCFFYFFHKKNLFVLNFLLYLHPKCNLKQFINL